MREPIACRVISFHDAGQAGHDWHHVTKVLTVSADIRVNSFTPWAVICQLESAMISKIHHDIISGIVDASRMLLHPCIADNEIDRHGYSQSNDNADTLARMGTVRSTELYCDR